MGKVLVEESSLSGIAAAIRQKNGTNTTYKPGQMAAAIAALPSASTLGSKSIVANGDYAASGDNLDGYSSVTVDVPNSYSQSDEGKVVNNGALVAQGSDTVTENGTVDTTLISSLVVNVSGGGGGGGRLIADWDFTQSLVDSVSGLEATLVYNASRDAEGIKLTGARQAVALDADHIQFLWDRTFVFTVEEMNLVGDDGAHYCLVTFGEANNEKVFCFRYGSQSWEVYDGAWRDIVLSGTETKNYWNGKELGLYLSPNSAGSGDGSLMVYANGTLVGTSRYSIRSANTKLCIGNSRGVANGGQCYNTTISRVRVYYGNHFE